MAYITQITLPDGVTYDIEDSIARQKIESFMGLGIVTFKGTSTAALRDGGNENPVVNGEPILTKKIGDLYFYGNAEYLYGDDNKWHFLGSSSGSTVEGLGSLAYKDSAMGNFKPTGIVSQPIFTGSDSSVTIVATENSLGNYQPRGQVEGGAFSGSSTTFTGKFTPHGTVVISSEDAVSKKVIVTPANQGAITYTPKGTITAPIINMQSAGETTSIKEVDTISNAVSELATSRPGAAAPQNLVTYYDVQEENLIFYQIGTVKTAPITTKNTIVKTSDANYTVTTPDFIGEGVRLETENISVPSSYTGTFVGQEEDIITSGIPNGETQPIIFKGAKVQFSGSTLPKGNVSQPIFTGSTKAVIVS